MAPFGPMDVYAGDKSVNLWLDDWMFANEGMYSEMGAYAMSKQMQVGFACVYS